MSDRPAEPAIGPSRRRAVQFIVFLGVVSLLADMTYEGARSATGPYLALLGASATAVGFVAGLGEFLGFAVRLASGYLGDRTGRYWAVTIFGYCLNLLAVPALALAGSWEAAAVLMVAERTGRAIRTPTRDAMLSQASARTGAGWAFGLHEALDQTGAIAGPLMVGAVLYFGGGYRLAFALLLIPALVCLIVLLAARVAYPRPEEFDLAPPSLVAERLPKSFAIYLGAVALIAAGYADFPLIAYHFGKAETVPAVGIAALYALAMATDGAAALVLGRWFDRVGTVAMAAATAGSLFAPPLVFLGGAAGATAGMVLWGIGMGAQESIMRAMVAKLAPPDRRATAYGIFGVVYGTAWFAGSVLLGVLYDRSIMAIVVAAMVLQACALPILLALGRSRVAGEGGAPPPHS